MQSITLAEFLTSKGMGGDYGSFDHGILSPSGRHPKRDQYKTKILSEHSSRTDAMVEYFALIDSGEVVDPSGKYPSPDFKAKAQRDAQYKIQQAERLEFYAAGGMRPRVHRKLAAELRQQAKELLARYDILPFPGKVTQ